MRLSFSAHSHQGKVRRDNQDFYLAKPEIGLFAVADGMGGHQGGALASHLVIEAIKTAADGRRLYSSRQLGFPTQEELEESADWLYQTFSLAGQLVKLAGTSGNQYKGLGSTLTAIYLDGLAVTVAHLGDSRAYQWRPGALYQLTNDHNLATEMFNQGLLDEEEAKNSPQANVLTRAICAAVKTIEPELYNGDFEPGDIFLICSDGLYRSIGDQAIFDRLEAGGDLSDLTTDLIYMANQAGGPDNITALIVHTEE